MEAIRIIQSVHLYDENNIIYSHHHSLSMWCVHVGDLCILSVNVVLSICEVLVHQGILCFHMHKPSVFYFSQNSVFHSFNLSQSFSVQQQIANVYAP